MLRRFAEAGGECLKSGALVILIIMYIAASMLIGMLHVHVTLPVYFNHSEVCLLLTIN